jgi:hypothetical protein
MGALSRPEEVLALVKLRVAAGQIKRQIPPEEHWAFGYSMLQKVSRSFALVIQQLGPELRNAVSTNSLHLPLSFFFRSMPHEFVCAATWNPMRGAYDFVRFRPNNFSVRVRALRVVF